MEKTRKTNDRSKNKEMAKSQKGITLVALVITIIIIIILATVTINMAFGDNGLITQAELARDMAANSTIAEQEGMNSLMDEYANIMVEPPAPFEPQPTPEPPIGGTEMTDMTNGVVEIKWLSGTSNKVTDTPNSPVIKKDLPTGMTMEQVVFDEESQTWIAGTDYSYVAGTGSNDNNASRWANARVTIDGIDSYFVWIPRYAYRIIYFNNSTSKQAYQNGILTEEDAVEQGKIIGYSDSRGIVDAKGRKIESITSESNSPKTMVSEDYFMVHPAFIDGKEIGFEHGEWNEELAGIWIGKYEVSLANKSDGSNIETDFSNADILLSDSENSDKTMVTRPGYASWRMYINRKYVFKCKILFSRIKKSYAKK